MLAALAATRSFFDGSPRQGDMLAPFTLKGVDRILPPGE